MKKLFGIIAFVMAAATINAQSSIDALFDKYSGKDGFVSVTINGNLLKLAASLDEDDESMPKNVTLIRILTQDDDKMTVDNFYDQVIKDIDLSKYEEFMSVLEKDEKLKMLVRTEGDKFSEFLMIAGGKDNNAIIQIKGLMSLEEAKKFARDAEKSHGSNVTIKK
jgi:hypothetical protein